MVMFDVVEAILLRCPVNDLLRCKSVCNSWKSLITSPSFAKTHVKFICNKEEENNTRKIAMITSFVERFEGSFLVPEEWEYYSRWFMQGSCNGLVCIKDRGHVARIFVINPVTREFRELQQPPPVWSTLAEWPITGARIFVINPVTREHRELQRSIPAEWRCFGFGYDSSTDDYKVVMAICQQDGDHALVHILSLKSNIWKLFGQVNYRFDCQPSGILFNGALHWFWFDSNDTSHTNILLVSFDLAKEEFREIPQPNDTRYVWNFGYRLGIIQGRLCIYPAYKEYICPSCGIWVMRSYNSWEHFPKDREIEDHAIHYMLKDTDEDRITPPPTYFCDENVHLSRSKEHIPCPMFVQTLLSPYAAGSV